MAFAKMEDLTGTCELVVFPDAYAKFELLLKEDRPMILGGFLEGDESNAKIIVDQICLLEEMLKKTKRMSFRLDKLAMEDYEKLYGILEQHPGSTRLQLDIVFPDLKQKVEMSSQSLAGVQMSNELVESLHGHFGRTDFIEVGFT